MVLLSIIKGVVIIVFGIFILRIAGRRSISQMTISQAVIVISLGTLLIGPVQSKNIWVTFAIAATIVATLIVIEYIQMKSNKMETFISGKSVMIIENGSLMTKNLETLRLTTDHLEMRLRQHQIEKISDVKWAAIEPSGHLSFVLQDYAKPATKADLQLLLSELQNGANTQTQSILPQKENTPLFDEIINSGHKTPQKDYLQ